MFTMNRAFVKESDQDMKALPERAISPHPNLVTARGMELLETRVRELETQRSAARAANDAVALASIARDLRYFQARRDSARPVSAATHPEQVRFGVCAVLQLPGKVQRAFQLVGEDEADPKAGLISFVSPLAKALMGKGVGDSVPFGALSAAILELRS